MNLLGVEQQELKTNSSVYLGQAYKIYLISHFCDIEWFSIPKSGQRERRLVQLLVDPYLEPVRRATGFVNMILNHATSQSFKIIKIA